MRITFLIAFWLCISSLHIKAQEGSFGQVSVDDFKVLFPGEEDAPAVVIHDIGKSRFVEGDYGFDIHFKRTVRIKINSKEGLDWGNVEIDLYQNGFNKTETVREIEAYTYLIEDGRIKRIPLGVDQVFEEKESDRSVVKKFVLPSVRENSIIEYRYTLITPFVFNLPDWRFQAAIPTLYSSYQVGLNPFYEYSFRLQGASRFDHQTSELEKGIPKRFGNIEYNDMVHTYVMKNIPPFKDESFISTREDYIVKLDFQLAKINRTSGGSEEIITTWEKLNDSILKEEYFGKYLNQASKQAGDIVSQIPADADKAKWLIEYFREKFLWNGAYSRGAIRKAKEVADSRSGNSAEINLFLCAAMMEAGLDAKPVLISTRSHGKLQSNYPFVDQFNNVLVLVKTNNGLMLTDGSQKYIPYNTIPPDCINGQGLIVDKKGAEFVSLSGFNNSQWSINLTLNPDPEANKITGGVLEQAQGYTAYYIRKRLDVDEDAYKEYSERFGIKGIEALEKVTGEDSRFSLKYLGQASLETLGENLIIAPFLDYPSSENILKSRERKLPLDMTYAKSDIFNSQIHIPEGYALDELPEPLTVDDDLVKISYSCKILGEYIVTNAEFTMKKSIYPASEYLRLRGHYIKMVESFNQHLILIKKAE